MKHIQVITRLSWFAAKKFAFFTPLVAIAMVGFFALCVAWIAWVFGLSAPDSTLGFLEEATLPAVGAMAKLSLVTFFCAIVAAFGRWCQLQAKLRLGPQLLSRVIRRFASNLALNLPQRFGYHILPPALTNGLMPRVPSRVIRFTASDLSGAIPLLN